jgi:hypothetical protein
MDAKALGQAQSLYNAMSGLYSGNMETMKSSLSALMQLINPGGSNSNYTSSGNTPGGSASPGGSSGSSGGGGGGMMGGAPSGPPQVNINVAVNGNEDEAKKFATLVAEYLQSNTLTSNLGGY